MNEEKTPTLKKRQEVCVLPDQESDNTWKNYDMSKTPRSILSQVNRLACPVSMFIKMYSDVSGRGNDSILENQQTKSGLHEHTNFLTTSRIRSKERNTDLSWRSCKKLKSRQPLNYSEIPSKNASPFVCQGNVNKSRGGLRKSTSLEMKSKHSNRVKYPRFSSCRASSMAPTSTKRTLLHRSHSHSSIAACEFLQLESWEKDDDSAFPTMRKTTTETKSARRSAQNVSCQEPQQQRPCQIQECSLEDLRRHDLKWYLRHDHDESKYDGIMHAVFYDTKNCA